MDKLSAILEPLTRFDPEGWVAFHRHLPAVAAVACLGAGGLAMIYGTGKLFRVVAVPFGALLGALLAQGLVRRFHLPPKLLLPILAVGFAAVGAVLPRALHFLAVGLFGAVIGGEIAGPPDYYVGFVPGFIAGGILGVVLGRVIEAVLASLFGAACVSWGALALLSHFASGRGFAGAPAGPLSVAAALFLGSIAHLLLVRPGPQELAKLKEEKERAKKEAKEREALNRKWEKYSSRTSGDD